MLVEPPGSRVSDYSYRQWSLLTTPSFHARSSPRMRRIHTRHTSGSLRDRSQSPQRAWRSSSSINAHMLQRLHSRHSEDELDAIRGGLKHSVSLGHLPFAEHSSHTYADAVLATAWVVCGVALTAGIALHCLAAGLRW
jgi:hypothetical protein